MGQHSPVGWVGRAWKVGVEGGAKGMAERRTSSRPLGPEVGRGEGGAVRLSALLHLLPKLFHPMAMEQSRAVGHIASETCSLGHSAGLLSLADPELLVMPIKIITGRLHRRSLWGTPAALLLGDLSPRQVRPISQERSQEHDVGLRHVGEPTSWPPSQT